MSCSEWMGQESLVYKTCPGFWFWGVMRGNKKIKEVFAVVASDWNLIALNTRRQRRNFSKLYLFANVKFQQVLLSHCILYTQLRRLLRDRQSLPWTWWWRRCPVFARDHFDSIKLYLGWYQTHLCWMGLEMFHVYAKFYFFPRRDSFAIQSSRRKEWLMSEYEEQETH